jgi:hypothetical protein
MTEHPFPLLLLAVHSSGGMLAILAGFAAMANPKGSPRHRGWGNLFFIGMMTLTVTGVYMAFVIRPVMGNLMGSALPLYLTATAWLTVRREPGRVGRLEVLALLWGVTVVVAGVTFARMALEDPRGRLDGYPAPYYLVMAGLALLGCVFDIRMIVRGGVVGVARTTRHLIRMSAALLMLTAAFFSGRARDFPLAIRESGVLKIPILIVVLLFVYWLVRVRVVPVVRRYWSKRSSIPEGFGGVAGTRRVPGEVAR